MQAFVVYESMYGNTAKIAEAIGRGLTEADMTVRVVPFQQLAVEQVVDADLLIVGGPTHAHGMSHEATRDTARSDEENTFDQPAPEPGSGSGCTTSRRVRRAPRLHSTLACTGRPCSRARRQAHHELARGPRVPDRLGAREFLRDERQRAGGG
jgi:hypothetical protein